MSPAAPYPAMPSLPLLQAARRFAALPPEERAFAARAWLAAPVVRASLALVGLKGTLRWVEAAPPRPLRVVPIGVTVGSRLVASAFRAHVAGGAASRCLPRSVVQYLLHRRDGLPARLVVGVKRSEQRPGIAAHAWIEGTEGGEDEASGFEPVFSTGPARGRA